MLKRLISIVLALIIGISAVSCAVPENSDNALENVDQTTDSGNDNTEKGNGENDQGSVSHKIILKNSDGTVFLEYDVSDGSLISEPTMPTVEGYTFIGWFEDPEKDIPFDFANAVYRDVTLYAKWNGGNASGVELTPIVFDSEYSISELEINTQSNTAAVRASVKDNCKVKVRFINEETYFSDTSSENRIYIESCFADGEITAAQGEESTKITLNIIGELPEYYVAEAVILDSSGNEISARAFNIKNTVRYESFINKTADAFSESEHVLRFDGSNDNNFGVLADDVKILTAQSITEIPLNNDGDLFYYIVGISGEVSIGDKIYVKANDGAEALFKADSINASGDGISVIPASAVSDNGYELSDFYKFIKVDMSSMGTVNSNAEDNVQPLDFKKDTEIYDKTFEVKKEPFKFEYNGLSFQSTVTGTVNIKCSYLYAPEIFGDEYFECSVIIDAGLSFSASLSYNASSEDNEANKLDRDEKPMVKIPTPIFAGFSPKLELGIVYEWEVKASVTAEISFVKRLGFKYNPISEITKINEKTDINPELKYEGEAKLIIGPTISLGVDFLKGIASANIEVVRAVELKATTADDEHMSEAGAEHNCFLCLSGSVDSIWDVDATLKVKLSKKLQWTLLKIDILSLNKNLYTGTLSKETKDSELKFIEGKCDNYSVEFGIWRFLNCPCFLREDAEGMPENMISLDRTCLWIVEIYKGETLIISAEGDGENRASISSIKDYVTLEYGEVYRIVLKQTCDVEYGLCSHGYLDSSTWICDLENESHHHYKENAPTLSSTTEYVGTWELKEFSDEWGAIFYYTDENNESHHLSAILAPKKIK